MSSTKWRRLNASFLGSQDSLQNASAVCSCIENILSPIRFVSRQDNFEEYQKAINVALAFFGRKTIAKTKGSNIDRSTEARKETP